MRKAFTLIELMISVSILSIIMIFLYRSYASLNLSNNIFKSRVQEIQTIQLKKKILYLDFTLALHKSISVLTENKDEDTVFFQTSNSMHKRFQPYVAYLIREKKLYRLESLKKFVTSSLPADAEFSAECFGEVNKFRAYNSTNKKEEIYLLHVEFKNGDVILQKVKVLNEF